MQEPHRKRESKWLITQHRIESILSKLFPLLKLNSVYENHRLFGRAYSGNGVGKGESLQSLNLVHKIELFRIDF